MRAPRRLAVSLGSSVRDARDSRRLVYSSCVARRRDARIKALFISQNFLDSVPVIFSFLFDKYYLIVD